MARLHTTLAQITRIIPKWICTEYTVLKIFLLFRIFEQLAIALKKEFALKIFPVLNIFFTIQDLWATLRLPWKTKFALKIFTVLNIFFTMQNFWATLHLSWKTEFALKICTVLNIFFTFGIFEQLALALKNNVSWIHCIEQTYIFLSLEFLSNLRLSWKTQLPWNFSFFSIQDI